jgi:hypothetical protein
LALGQNATDFRLMHDTARRLRTAAPGLSIIVIGQTFHDLALMRLGNVFVTGPVPGEDVAGTLRQYQVEALFVASRRPVFGHPSVVHAASSQLPTAFFDWSFGRLPAPTCNLALDPRVSSDIVTDKLADWLGA